MIFKYPNPSTELLSPIRPQRSEDRLQKLCEQEHMKCYPRPKQTETDSELWTEFLPSNKISRKTDTAPAQSTRFKAFNEMEQ